MQAEFGSTVEDALVALRPAYFIMDDSIARYTITAGSRPIPELNSAETLRASIQGFLDRNGTVVSTSETAAFGEVRVYRIDWGDESSGE